MPRFRKITRFSSFIIYFFSPLAHSEFLILDDYMVFDESQNGFMYYWESGHHFPEDWPEDWTIPKNYYRGYWMARYEVFDTPMNLCHSYQLCIWQVPADGDAAQAAELETCSSPYTYITGPDIYTTQTNQLSSWWKKNSGANGADLDRPRDFDRLGVVFRTCEGCYVTPYNVEPNCWAYRDDYLPVDMRITIVAVSEGETFSGWDNYIQGPKLEPPSLSSGNSLFTGSTIVELSSSDAVAEIRYTIDGSIPGPGSLLYDDAIMLTESTQLLARTYRTGFTPSNISSARYVNLKEFGPDGLIALWNFDGDLQDQVGGLDGIPRGGDPEFIEGRAGSALSVPDPANVVEVPQMDFNPVALTVAAWILPSSDDDNAARILSKTWGSASALSLQDLVFSSYAAFGSQLFFSLKVDNLTETVIAPARLKNDIWTHVAATYDGSSIKLYKDGELVKEREVSGEITFSDDRPLVIGNHAGGSDDELNWAGGLDDVRIYARALDEAEIRKLAEITPSSCTFPLGSLWVDAERNDDCTAIAGSLGKVGDLGWPDLVYLQGLGEPIAVRPEGAARLASEGGFTAWRCHTGDWIWTAEDLGGWCYSYSSGWFHIEIEIPDDSLWLDAERNADHTAKAVSLGDVDDVGYPDFVYISALHEPVEIWADKAARTSASGGFFAWRYLSRDWIWTAEDINGWVYSFDDGWEQP